MEVAARARRRTVHRDDVTEGHPQQADARQPGGAHGKIVVVGIELDKDVFGRAPAIALGEQRHAATADVLDVRCERGGFAAVELHHERGRADATKVVLLETVEQPQRVDGGRAERVAFVRLDEMLPCLGAVAETQEIDAELLVRAPQRRLQLDGPQQPDVRLAVLPPHQFEMRELGVDAAIARVVLLRLVQPALRVAAAEQLDGREQRLRLERRDALRLREVERALRVGHGLVAPARFECEPPAQQVRLDQRVVLRQHCVEQFLRARVEPLRQQARHRDARLRVLARLLERLTERALRFRVLVRFEEQPPPTHPSAHRRLRTRECLAERRVRAVQVAAPPGRFGADQRIGILAEAFVAAQRVGIAAAQPRVVAGTQCRRPRRVVVDLDGLGSRGEARHQHQRDDGSSAHHGVAPVGVMPSCCSRASRSSPSRAMFSSTGSREV